MLRKPFIWAFKILVGLILIPICVGYSIRFLSVVADFWETSKYNYLFLTGHSLMRKQRDLTKTGLVFSIPVIVMGNIMVVAFVLTVLMGNVRDYPDFLRCGFDISWDITRSWLDVVKGT